MCVCVCVWVRVWVCVCVSAHFCSPRVPSPWYGSTGQLWAADRGGADRRDARNWSPPPRSPAPARWCRSPPRPGCSASGPRCFWHAVFAWMEMDDPDYWCQEPLSTRLRSHACTRIKHAILIKPQLLLQRFIQHRWTPSSFTVIHSGGQHY